MHDQFDSSVIIATLNILKRFSSSDVPEEFVQFKVLQKILHHIPNNKQEPVLAALGQLLVKYHGISMFKTAEVMTQEMCNTLMGAILGKNLIPSDPAEQCFVALSGAPENHKLVLENASLDFLLEQFKVKWEREVGIRYAETLWKIASGRDNVRAQCGKTVINICLRMLKLRPPKYEFSLLNELMKYPPNLDVVSGSNGVSIVVAATKKYKNNAGLKILRKLAAKEATINATLLSTLGDMLVQRVNDFVDPEICTLIFDSIKVCVDLHFNC